MSLSVSPTSYSAQTLDMLINALADCASFRTAVGAADAAAAKALIVRQWSGEPEDQATPGMGEASDGSPVDLKEAHGLVEQEGPIRHGRSSAIGYGISGTHQVRVIIPRAADSPANAVNRHLNLQGAIAVELKAQVGTVARPWHFDLEEQAFALGEKGGPYEGFLITTITVNWRS